MYRIYGYSKKNGRQKIDSTSDKKEAFEIASKINPKEYYSYVIVADIGNGDEVIGRKDFSRECTIEFVDEVKTKVEVKATTFKPTRMKRKQEERKMFEQYIDR